MKFSHSCLWTVAFGICLGTAWSMEQPQAAAPLAVAGNPVTHGAFLLRSGMRVAAPPALATIPVVAPPSKVTNQPVVPPRPPLAMPQPVIPPPPPVAMPHPAMPPQPVAVRPPVVASKPVAVPTAPVNTPLPSSVLLWDSEMKSIDAHEGDAEGRLSYSFTNVSKTDVVISNVHPGCGCTTAQLPPLPWTIPAGSNGQFGVTINLHGKTGTFFKGLTVTTDKGIKSLNFRVYVRPVPRPEVTAADRAKMLMTSQADRQAVLKGDCAVCHVKRGEGRYGQRLYDEDCGICHDSEHRATMVPDLHNLKVPTNAEFWRIWIAHGKPGGLMPAFSIADGGPLNDMQINTLVSYLTQAMPSKPATAAPVPPPVAH